MSCRREDLSLSQKLKIVQLASEKVSETEIFRQFGYSQSTVSKTISQKEELKHEAADNKIKDCKRHGILIDEDISVSVCQDTVDPQPDSEDEINEDLSPASKSRHVILALCTLRGFMEQHTEDVSTFYKMETQIQKLMTSKAKQHGIRDFFQSTCVN